MLFRKSLYLFLLCSPLLLSAKSPYPQPKSFSHATNIYKQIDYDYTRTAFSNKMYAYDAKTCMDKLYLKENPKRKVVLTRIVPEELLLAQRKCGQEKICLSYLKKPYKGKRCCRKTDKVYQAYDRDIFNVIVMDKKNLRKLKHPPAHFKGNIARVYLYMNAQYGLNLSYEEQNKYLKWHSEDKVDEKECAIYQQIRELQGRTNPWIEKACQP